MLALMNKTTSSLRGGGCGTFRMFPRTQENLKSDILDIENFINKFNHFVEIIFTKAAVAINSIESQEIMIAIQWFVFQEEIIYKLNKNPLNIIKSYNLIVEGIKKLLQSCLIYIRTDSFKCLYILQITAALSKVIFSFHIMNSDRIMNFNLQKQFLEISDDLKQQMEIEKNDLIQIQMEVYLFLTKTSFEIAPNNNQERIDILKRFVNGIFESLNGLKPNAELLESLYLAASQIHKIYTIQKNRKQYEVYFQIDMLQWEIISCFRNEKFLFLKKVILQIQEIYEELVKKSNNWKNHFLWIQMIGKILIFNPLITKKRLNELTNSNDFVVNLRQIWKEYQNKGLLIQLNHTNDQAVILLSQIQNNKIIELDRQMLEDSFRGWKDFLILKQHLIGQLNEKIPYTINSYLRCKFDLLRQDPQKNEKNLNIERMKMLLSFIIPTSLINLIKQNIEKLGEVIKVQKSFRKNEQAHKSLLKSTVNSQLKRIICNLSDYLQNTQKILKIFQLNQKKNYCQTDQLQENDKLEFNNLFQLKYLLKLLEEILLQAVQEIRNKRNPFCNQDGITDEIKILQQQKELIQEKLKNLNLKDNQFSFVNELQQKLLTLLIATLDYKSFLKKAHSILKLVEDSKKQIQTLEILLLQKNNFIQCFQSLLNQIYFEEDQKIQKDFQESILSFKTILISQYEIESVEEFGEIKQQISNMLSFQFVNNLRLNNLKLQLQLIALKESFQNIFLAKLKESQSLIEVIDLDEFLVNVINNYPKIIIFCHENVYKQIFIELTSMQITEQDYQNKLSKQKGLIEYLTLILNLEEQLIDLEKIDLELIDKEFGELFKEESCSSSLTERIIKIIENAQIENSIKSVTTEQFNQSELNFEIEKYENVWKQLRVLKKNYNCQENQNFKEVIRHIEMIVELLNNSQNQNLEIFKIPIMELLEQLKSIQSEFQQKLKNDQCQQNKNDQILPDQNPIQEQNIDSCDQNTTQIKGNQEHVKELQIIISILKLLSSQIKEQKLLLCQILEETKKFSNILHLLHKYDKNIQEKTYLKFHSHFKSQIEIFEKSLCTKTNLQQMEKESFIDYYNRIEFDIQQAKNEKDDENKQQKTNVCDFLNNLKGKIKLKLSQSKCIISKIQFEEEYLIQQIKKIYLSENEEEEEEDKDDEESNKKLGFFQSLNQQYKDYKNNDEWKIKQGLIFTIIQISSNCFTDTIIQFCQQALIQLWVLEKDQRVRNLLKNQDLISLQMQILKKGWQTQNDRIAGEMQQMLSKIDSLQEQITQEANVNKREQQLKEIDETTEKLDEYIKNICEMGQQLRLITDFVNHFRKGLIRVEGKINEMKKQLNSLGNDIKFLRGKSVEELFDIRKSKVLKEAANKNVRSIYVPLQTLEIFHQLDKVEKNEQKTILMNFENFSDKEGEVNEFLLDDKETVLLIHGLAGSGKSTAAKKIEEFIWKLYENNQRIKNQKLIPIYISLPSLKNPVFQAVEEALHQDEYGFDELQLKECKEMLEKKEFRFLFIMDSYDEMKLENIQKNLYINNKLKQNWSNPFVIFTTRSEIFTSSNYSLWFEPEEKQKLKEIKLLKFDSPQMLQYLEKFTIQSVKMLIFEIYEWQTQISNRGAIDIKKFENCWEKLNNLLKKDILGMKRDNLLNQKQIDLIKSFLKNDQFISLKSQDALRSLSINLQKLWSVEKYNKMMSQINLNKLVVTPYMMEIVVQVLPDLIVKATEINNLKQNFINNFSKKLKALYKSKYLIEMYQQQQQQEKLVSQNNREENSQKVTSIDIENLEKLNFQDVANKFWDKIEENSTSIQTQISQENPELQTQLQKILEQICQQYDHLLDKVAIQNKKKSEAVIEVVIDALKELNLTSYDFYDEFINQHHQKQIEKQRKLGKSINIDRFLHDLKKYSTNLAKKMSIYQITQVQYQQQGFLYKEEKENEKWLNDFFNDDDQFGSYRKDIRSCSLVQSNGANFQFVHKSIQEFLIAATLYELLVQSKDVDIQIMKTILELLSKENNQVQDSSKFLQTTAKEYCENHTQFENILMFDRQKQIEKKIKSIADLIKIVQEHDFNKNDYSTEIYAETRQYLIQKISQEVRIIEFLKFLVHLTKIDENIINSGSNALNILVEMKTDLTNQNFQNITIKNTSLYGGNFSKCNLSQSKFDNVNINGINLNGAILFDCNWKKLKINDLYKLDGHSQPVSSVSFSPDGKTLASGSQDNFILLWEVKTGQNTRKLNGRSAILSICFSPDGNTLASGSSDKSICLWDIKTGQQKAKLDDHTDQVRSVCFSPDGNTLASGSQDNSILLWEVKTGLNKRKLDGHTDYVISVCFSPDGNILASGSQDNSILLWEVKTGLNKRKLDGHSAILSICFSPDGNTLVSTRKNDIITKKVDNKILLWDVKTGQQLAQLDGHTNTVYSVCFSPDGTTLASASGDDDFYQQGDNSIRLWDFKTRQQKAKIDGHTSAILSVCFSPDGNTLASGSGDKSIHLWDVNAGQQTAKSDGHTNGILSVCFSPDGNTLASGSSDKSICLWDIKTGQLKAKLDDHTDQVRSVCFSPDGNMLASSSKDQFIRLWDVKTGQQKELNGDRVQFISVSFSPDGNILASGSEDTFIRLWDINNRQQIAKLDGHTDQVRSVCFSPDGNMLASGSNDQSICLWDVKTRQQKANLNGDHVQVISVCFSPDGNILASGSEDTFIRLWDINNRQQIAKLDGHTDQVRSVCFSPDGNMLASGSNDQSICLWDVKTRQQKEKLNGHTSYVIQVCFSPDGNILASGSEDKSIRLWDINPNTATIITILHISQAPIFQAQRAHVHNGEFINYQDFDLRQLFKSKGSII
ncbi:unnamed protein product [Paramecium pentaurelia]|uniref:NACHT domain-containing protein n=1 Tax=Paramecium pentaurelia TaxID=43138 RepID=A0A8S1XBL7_9CILI|nr:unnamed protein product [Paramecium pentaurelia]